ncbi:YeiH family protein [Desulfovulcanus sp.]
MLRKVKGMEKRNTLNLLKESWLGVFVAILIGVLGYGIRVITRFSLADPLLVAMIIGIIFRTAMKEKTKLKSGFTFAPRIFIPMGVVFYAAKNLNFVKFARIETSMIVLLVIVMFVYFAVILTLGTLLRQKKQITYLTATGSAICGASAIAMVSSSIEAEPDDTSISLLSVALTATVGLFIFLPFLATLFGMTNKIYGLLSGSVLQFTGFVKVAAENVPYLTMEMPGKEVISLALSIKAVRYLGLLIAIPLFASLAKRKFYTPWFLWVFLGAGVLGSWICAVNEIFYTESLMPVITPIYNISWSIVMAAVGLNADIKQLLSNNGTKALIMAFAGFVAAVTTFLVGLYIIQLF